MIVNQNKLYFPFPVQPNQVVKIIVFTWTLRFAGVLTIEKIEKVINVVIAVYCRLAGCETRIQNPNFVMDNYLFQVVRDTIMNLRKKMNLRTSLNFKGKALLGMYG
jgi:hypothetical protein